MTTLEERRQWMRNGCPVPSVSPETPCVPLLAPGEWKEWEGFTLTVGWALNGVNGTLYGQCLRCGAKSLWTWLEKTKAPITGVLKQVKAAQEWMVDHAVDKHGLRTILAREVYGKGMTRLWVWAAQIMSAGKSINGGWMTAPGSPHSGVYLYGDPSK